MKLSVSKIEEFAKCKYSYFLSNISKNVKRGEDSPEAKKGDEIHKLFEEAYNDVLDKKDKEEILKAVENKIKANPNYEKYKSHADNFIVLNQKTGGSIPLYRETKLFDPELNIVGIIDRVDYDGKNLVVIDYKTGKEKELKDHWFQLAIYTYLFQKNHNQQPTHWGIYYSDTGNLKLEKVKWDLVRKAINRVSSIRKKIQEIEESGQWVKSPSYLCKWCRHYNKNNGQCNGGGRNW